mgnify:CR=1 FL=1
MKYHNVAFYSGIGLLIIDLFKQQPFILGIPTFMLGIIGVLLSVFLWGRKEKVFIKKLTINNKEWI